ncbi:cytochrome P450 [Sulfitobacter sp. LCG007]
MSIQSTGSGFTPIKVDPRLLAEDPHAKLAKLRRQHALVQLGERQYMALRAEDVLAMLTDPRTSQVDGPEYVKLQAIPDGATADFMSEFFLFSNGAEHRAKRGYFSRAFAFSKIREIRPEVRKVADGIVASLPRGESFEFVEQMAARIPAEMIAAILGLPASDADHFAPLVHSMSRAIRPVYPHAHHGEIESAVKSLRDYVGDALRARLDVPCGDMLSNLVADWHENPVITFDSLVHQVLGVIVGGTDTTRAGFAMLVSLLLQHPEAWRAVKSDPALAGGAVSEALRYDPVVGSVARLTTKSLTVREFTLAPGVLLRLSTLSALRDPLLYSEPERFDIRRTDHPRLHSVFGLGPHRCLGEMLARIEMEEGLLALAGAAPDIEMLSAPQLTGFGGIRQISDMVVRIP